ncbi:MAG: hypothetical protein VYD08_04640 [Pseudomonadota bacterium]|nr:hypothetical protein [Pseudomonadota bacterium]|tara:strand:+ start:4027 stop:4533 length:507 start_codon:yes stop_codon:yes gene_type:complete
MEYLKTLFGSVLLFGTIAYGASAFTVKQDDTFGHVELGMPTNVPNVVDGVLYQSTPAIAFPTTTDKRLTAFLPTGIEGKVTAVKGQSGKYVPVKVDYNLSYRYDDIQSCQDAMRLIRSRYAAMGKDKQALELSGCTQSLDGRALKKPISLTVSQRIKDNLFVDIITRT